MMFMKQNLQLLMMTMYSLWNIFQDSLTREQIQLNSALSFLTRMKLR